MRIGDERQSENVEDQRGWSGGGFPGGGRGLSLGGIVVALIASAIFGVDPRVFLGMGGDGPAGQSQVATGPAAPPPQTDQMGVFVSRVLATTEDTWEQIFSEGGKQYRAPKLVLFTG